MRPVMLKKTAFADRLRCWALSGSSDGGSWVQTAPLYNISSSFYGDPYYLAIPKSAVWTWKPATHCKEPVRPFARTRICTTLAGRKLLVVGDSISEEVFLSIANSLEEMRTVVDFRGGSTNSIRVCEGSVLLDFVRNDRLSLGVVQDTVDAEGRKIFIEYPWAIPDHLSGADIILLNRGAHYEDDNTLLQAIEEALLFVQTTVPAARIVWRTTPRGHTEYAATLHAPPLSDDVSPDILAGLPYNWGRFPAQNARVIELLERRFPRVSILDVAPALGLRHDGHVDGLHYVLPGPLDHVTASLFHFLPEILG